MRMSRYSSARQSSGSGSSKVAEQITTETGLTKEIEIMMHCAIATRLTCPRCQLCQNQAFYRMVRFGIVVKGYRKSELH